jgi:hypothetical protein
LSPTIKFELERHHENHALTGIALKSDTISEKAALCTFKQLLTHSKSGVQNDERGH